MKCSAKIILLKKNETSAFKPISPYAISKLYSYWMVRAYRKGYGMYAANGILFNHESPLRGLEFVTRKISNGVAKISLGLSKSLKLGNFNAKRDWGYAPEFVEGMWKILQQKNPIGSLIWCNEPIWKLLCSHAASRWTRRQT